MDLHDEGRAEGATCVATTVAGRSAESNNNARTNHPDKAESPTIAHNEGSAATNPTDLQGAGRPNRTNAVVSNRAVQTPPTVVLQTVLIAPIDANLGAMTAHEEAAQT